MTERQFREQILTHYRMMYACAFAIVRQESDAQDCVQEAVTRLWEKRHTLDKIDNPKAYAMSTVRNVAVSMFSSCRADALREDLPFGGAPPDHMLEAKDSLSRIEALLEKLPANQRRVIVLTSIAGLSQDEITEATGISGGNVRVLLSRGRKKLKELFDEL